MKYTKEALREIVDFIEEYDGKIYDINIYKEEDILGVYNDILREIKQIDEDYDDIEVMMDEYKEVDKKTEGMSNKELYEYFLNN